MHAYEAFSPPWCDRMNSYRSLQDIPMMSYLPDSFKVRSGPGVSAIYLTLLYDKVMLAICQFQSVRVGVLSYHGFVENRWTGRR